MVIKVSTTQHPVVLRFEGMFPDQLDGYEDHRLRVRGDDGNIVREKSHLNRLLIGGPDWAPRLRAEIEEMRAENFIAELEGLERRRRRKDRERRRVEGPKDPWRKTRHGPLRELILTANAEWFRGFSVVNGKPLSQADKEALFERLAVDWLRAEFGEDVVHARADRDELAYHIHAVIAPRETKSVNGATRRMLQPSKFRIIENYELAQDSVGAWFARADLTRGERRAAATREARQRGEDPPPKPRHTRPHAWRKAEEARLALLDNAVEGRAKAVAGRENAVDRKSAEVRTAAADVARRESAVAQKETEVARREAAARRRVADADAVIDLAERVAGGEIEIEVPEGGPAKAVAAGPAPSAQTRSLVDRLAGGGAIVARALDAFARLRARLVQQARDAVGAREEELARNVADLRATDDAIVEIAKALPAAERSRIAGLRETVARRMVGLERRISKTVGRRSR